MAIKTSTPSPFSNMEKGSDESGEHIPGRDNLSSGLTAQQYVDERKKQQARFLRKQSTLAEKILWERLRNRQLNGLKFRRQQVIDGFIADFYCETAKLVVEVDGGIHDLEKQQQDDERKDEVFSSRGLYVLRLKNELILNEIQTALDRIAWTAFKRIAAHLTPSPRRRGGKGVRF